DKLVTGVQTCALPICRREAPARPLPCDGEADRGRVPRSARRRDPRGAARAARPPRGASRPALRAAGRDGRDSYQIATVRTTATKIGRASCRERVEIWV